MSNRSIGLPRCEEKWFDAEHEQLGSHRKTDTLKAIFDGYRAHQATLASPVANATEEKPAETPAAEIPPPPATPAEAKPTEKREVYISYVDQET